MDKAQILEAAIQKAIEGGWSNSLSGYEDILLYAMRGILGDPYDAPSIEQVIFNHDFAKALWGEYSATSYAPHYIPARGYPGEKIPKNEIKDSAKEENWNCTRCRKKWRQCFEKECLLLQEGNNGWQRHLQNMVISEDPIKYLADNLA